MCAGVRVGPHRVMIDFLKAGRCGFVEGDI